MQPGLISFHADKVIVRGPKIDGTYVVSFEVGEYEQDKVAELLKVKQQTLLNVTVETDHAE